ncbi:SHOCT domain-containing protein [Lactobacillus helveticus]|uniref:SHOCT domain-containing protein n=1 Tax=Lactobacillus helveticus TaxID=1587 RepID=UPI0028800D03|nr:SHOCT domain-containing protein [Lactobacillus helveticus]
MLVCSNRNLIILKKKHSDEQVEVIDLKRVKNVILKNQLMYGELSLIVGNQSLDINSINKVPAEIFADNIKKWSKIAQGEDDDFDQQLDQVKKLKELLDQGILTEEEFQAKKKQILKI